jgi:biopolymer transport protein ExbD
MSAARLEGAFPPRPPRSRRRPSLTPMIDVVFLLLVFFMLASRFGQETAVTVSGAGSGGVASAGAPRLVDVLPDALRLNGRPVALADLSAALAALTESGGDLIVLRPREGADLQRVLDVLAPLVAAGFTGLALTE